MITVVILALLAGGGYWAITKKSGSSLISSSDGNWLTYRNEEHGFEFKYPVDWKTKISQKYGGMETEFTDKMGKTILLLHLPIPEIGYEAWALKNERRISIPNSQKYLTRFDYQPSADADPTFTGFVLVNWSMDNWKNSGQLSVPEVSNENDYRLKLLDEILATFRFTEQTYEAKIFPTGQQLVFTVRYPDGWRPEYFYYIGSRYPERMSETETPSGLDLILEGEAQSGPNVIRLFGSRVSMDTGTCPVSGATRCVVLPQLGRAFTLSKDVEVQQIFDQVVASIVRK